MDNIEAYLKLVELEMKLYNTVNDVVINAVTEKYKNASVNSISYSLPVMDSVSSDKSNSAPESNSSIKSREDRLKYMRECQKNWRKPIPRGGRK